MRRSRKYRTLTSQGSFWETAYRNRIHATCPPHHSPATPGHPPIGERPGSPHSKQLNPSPTRDQYKKHSASAEGNGIRGDRIHFGTLGTHLPEIAAGQVHPTASSSILRQPEINTKNTLLPPKVMRSAATGSILGLSARTAQKCRRPGSPHSKQLNPSPTRDQYKKHSASAEGNEIRGDGIHFGTLGTHRPKVSPPRFTPQQEADALEMRKSTH
jgi:hypothetical protein